jgi:hypothetical protein
MPQGASGRAITAMILSIVALVSCGPFTSIPGLILGKLEMDAIQKGEASQAGATFAKVGFYMGLGVTALYCIALPLLFFLGALGGIID